MKPGFCCKQQTARNPVSGQRWRAPAGQLMDAEQQELLSAAQALARLVTELAAEDTFFSYLR